MSSVGMKPLSDSKRTLFACLVVRTNLISYEDRLSVSRRTRQVMRDKEQREGRSADACKRLTSCMRAWPTASSQVNLVQQLSTFLPRKLEADKKRRQKLKEWSRAIGLGCKTQVAC